MIERGKPGRSALDQLMVLQAYCTGEEQKALIALSAERRLGASALLAFGLSVKSLQRSVEGGLIFVDGEVRPLSITRGPAAERAYILEPSLRQLILRRAQAADELTNVVNQCEKLLGRRSVAGFSRRLQEGSLVFRDDGTTLVEPGAERELRRSVILLFDGAWLQRTWGEKSSKVTGRVLAQALPCLNSVGDLYAWLTGQAQFSLAESCARVLMEHALHRLDLDFAQGKQLNLDAATRLGFEAVKQFQGGKKDLAKELLMKSLGFAAKKHPLPHAWTPLLALLLALQPGEEESNRATAWLSVRGADAAQKAAARGLRVFLRHRNDPTAHHRRINAHQMGQEAPAWEVLFLGLAAFESETQEGPRASWSQLLCERAARWMRDGYPWMGRQAYVLARALHRQQFEKASVFGDGFEPQPGDLCDLIKPREPWELALHALGRLDFLNAEPPTRLRLEWYINPYSGSVNRPGLQEFEKGRGWSTVRRIGFDEARECQTELPIEDQKALERTDGGQGEFPHAEVLEALVGHGRVVDGARGGTPLKVARGSCRVVTRDEVEFLVIEVVPKGVGPGLNILFDGESVVSVVKVSPAMEQVLATLPPNFRVPLARSSEALGVIERLAETVEVKSPHLVGTASQEADSTPCLRIAPTAGAYLIEGGVRPFGSEARFFPVGHGPALLSATRGGKRLRTERQFDVESRRMAQLIAACPILVAGQEGGDQSRAPGEANESWMFGEDRMMEMLAEIKASGLSCEFEWPASVPRSFGGTLSARHLSGALRSKKGWYLVSGQVAIDDVTRISLAELARLPTFSRGRFVRLPSGDFLEVEKRVRRVMAALAGVSTDGKSSNELRVGRVRLPSLRALSESSNFTVDEGVQEALKNLDAVATRPIELPLGLRASLRDYQLAGFRWLARLSDWGLGACLADDMGLGKTVQILALLLRAEPGSQHLVVAPTSVCTNWLREIERFAPSLEAVEYLGSRRVDLLAVDDTARKKKTRVVIVSYGLLHEDREELNQPEWDTVVLDEAQFIKNAHSLRAQAAYSLKARHRVAATGTPVENHLGDIWSLFHFLNPELLGDWRSFEAHFAKPIQRDGDSIRGEALRDLLRPYILRRTKNQVLKELPKITRIRHEITPSKDEGLRYALLRKQIHNKLYTTAGKRHTKLEVLAEITRLRRFCCHPQLVFPEAPLESRKVEALIDLVDELRQNGHRALVFSQYVDFLGMVKDRLSEQGIAFESLDGSTPKAARQASIDRFQAGSTPLFLISLKAGGLGINLTAADYVIHLDPWWNPAVASQATDRAHRIGQQRPVTVYEFVTRGSIEEDILQLHKSKQRLADSLLEGSDKAAELDAHELSRWLQESVES